MFNWMFEFKSCKTKHSGIYEYSWRVKHQLAEGCTLGTRNVYETLCWVETFSPTMFPGHLVTIVKGAGKNGWFAKAPDENVVRTQVMIYRTRESAALHFLLDKLAKEAVDTRKSMTHPTRHSRRNPLAKPMISEYEAEEVQKILTEECGYKPRYHNDFVHALTERNDGEYRFEGYLGFGGKLFWGWDGYYVTNYSENSDGASQLMIARADKKLSDLWHRFGSAENKI